VADAVLGRLGGLEELDDELVDLGLHGLLPSGVGLLLVVLGNELRVRDLLQLGTLDVVHDLFVCCVSHGRPHGCTRGHKTVSCFVSTKSLQRAMSERTVKCFW
jgi:hypothetical protein